MRKVFPESANCLLYFREALSYAANSRQKDDYLVQVSTRNNGSR